MIEGTILEKLTKEGTSKISIPVFDPLGILEKVTKDALVALYDPVSAAVRDAVRGIGEPRGSNPIKLNGSIAPQPQFFAHTTLHWKEIQDTGYIMPHPESGDVPVSLDGVWGAMVNTTEHTFLFNISEIHNYKTVPIFYLGTESIFTTEEFNGFAVMDMAVIWATEVWVKEPIPIDKARLVTRIPDTPLESYLSRAIRKLISQARPLRERAFIPGEITTMIPPPDVLEIVHGYNRMVANLFGIDYQEVLRKAEELIASGESEWVKWW